MRCIETPRAIWCEQGDPSAWLHSLWRRLQPRNGRMAHTIATRDIHQRLARLAPCQSLLPLMRRELVRAAKAHAALFGTLAAFTGPGADQLALKLRQAAAHQQHQPALPRRSLCADAAHAH